MSFSWLVRFFPSCFFPSCFFFLSFPKLRPQVCHDRYADRDTAHGLTLQMHAFPMFWCSRLLFTPAIVTFNPERSNVFFTGFLIQPSHWPVPDCIFQRVLSSTKSEKILEKLWKTFFRHLGLHSDTSSPRKILFEIYVTVYNIASSKILEDRSRMFLTFLFEFVWIWGRIIQIENSLGSFKVPLRP